MRGLESFRRLIIAWIINCSAGNSKIAESLRKLAAALQELEDAEIESRFDFARGDRELLGESVRLLREPGKANLWSKCWRQLWTNIGTVC